MKNLFLGVLICLVFTGCSNQENGETSERYTPVRKANKVVDPSSFQTPYDSKVWDVMSGKITTYAKVIENYRIEKTKYGNELHFENTMDTWHKTLVKFSKDMSLADAEEILRDMDDLPTNIISYSTYYKLIKNFSDINNRKERLEMFYNKNMDFLQNAKWKNEEIRQKVIMGFKSNQMMISL